MSISMFKSTAKLAGTMRNSVKSVGDVVGQSTGLDVLKKKKMHDNLPSIGGELSGWVHLEQAGHLVKHGGMEKQWLEVQGGTVSWTTEKGRAKGEEPYAVGKLTGCTVSIPKSKRRGWPHCVRIDLKKADSMFMSKFVFAATSAAEQKKWMVELGHGSIADKSVKDLDEDDIAMFLRALDITVKIGKEKEDIADIFWGNSVDGEEFMKMDAAAVTKLLTSGSALGAHSAAAATRKSALSNPSLATEIVGHAGQIKWRRDEKLRRAQAEGEARAEKLVAKSKTEPTTDKASLTSLAGMAALDDGSSDEDAQQTGIVAQNAVTAATAATAAAAGGASPTLRLLQQKQVAKNASKSSLFETGKATPESAVPRDDERGQEQGQKQQQQQNEGVSHKLRGSAVSGRLSSKEAAVLEALSPRSRRERVAELERASSKPTTKSHKVTAMRAMFQAASQDRGPVLKRKDIKQWIIDADGSGADAPSEARVSQIMTQIDRNCDGEVDFEEFSAFVEHDKSHGEGKFASSIKKKAGQVERLRDLYDVLLPEGQPNGELLVRDDVKRWYNEAHGKSLDASVSDPELSGMLERLGADSNGRVNFEGFSAFVKHDLAQGGQMAGTLERMDGGVARMKAMFVVALPNAGQAGAGERKVLVKQDVRNWSQKAHGGVAPSESEVSKLMLSLDTNGDGVVDFPEFSAFMKSDQAQGGKLSKCLEQEVGDVISKLEQRKAAAIAASTAGSGAKSKRRGPPARAMFSVDTGEEQQGLPSQSGTAFSNTHIKDGSRRGPPERAVFSVDGSEKEDEKPGVNRQDAESKRRSNRSVTRRWSVDDGTQEDEGGRVGTGRKWQPPSKAQEHAGAKEEQSNGDDSGMNRLRSLFEAVLPPGQPDGELLGRNDVKKWYNEAHGHGHEAPVSTPELDGLMRRLGADDDDKVDFEGFSEFVEHDLDQGGKMVGTLMQKVHAEDGKQRSDRSVTRRWSVDDGTQEDEGERVGTGRKWQPPSKAQRAGTDGGESSRDGAESGTGDESSLHPTFSSVARRWSVDEGADETPLVRGSGRRWQPPPKSPGGEQDGGQGGGDNGRRSVVRRWSIDKTPDQQDSGRHSQGTGQLEEDSEEDEQQLDAHGRLVRGVSLNERELLRGTNDVRWPREMTGLQQRRAMFEQVDQDNDGLIGSADIHQLFKVARDTGAVNPKDLVGASLILQEMNCDDDGKVGEADFCKWMDTTDRNDLLDCIEQLAAEAAHMRAEQVQQAGGDLSQLGSWPTGLTSLEKRRAMFEHVDKDNDGVVSKSDMRKMVRKARGLSQSHPAPLQPGGGGDDADEAAKLGMGHTGFGFGHRRPGAHPQDGGGDEMQKEADKDEDGDDEDEGDDESSAEVAELALTLLEEMDVDGDGVVDEGDFNEWLVSSPRQDLVEAIEQQTAEDTSSKLMTRGTGFGFETRRADGGSRPTALPRAPESWSPGVSNDAGSPGRGAVNRRWRQGVKAVMAARYLAQPSLTAELSDRKAARRHRNRTVEAQLEGLASAASSPDNSPGSSPRGVGSDGGGALHSQSTGFGFGKRLQRAGNSRSPGHPEELDGSLSSDEEENAIGAISDAASLWKGVAKTLSTTVKVIGAFGTQQQQTEDGGDGDGLHTRSTGFGFGRRPEGETAEETGEGLDIFSDDLRRQVEQDLGRPPRAPRQGQEQELEQVRQTEQCTAASLNSRATNFGFGRQLGAVEPQARQTEEGTQQQQTEDGGDGDGLHTRSTGFGFGRRPEGETAEETGEGLDIFSDDLRRQVEQDLGRPPRVPRQGQEQELEQVRQTEQCTAASLNSRATNFGFGRQLGAVEPQARQTEEGTPSWSTTAAVMLPEATPARRNFSARPSPASSVTTSNDSYLASSPPATPVDIRGQLQAAKESARRSSSSEQLVTDGQQGALDWRTMAAERQSRQQTARRIRLAADYEHPKALHALKTAKEELARPATTSGPLSLGGQPLGSPRIGRRQASDGLQPYEKATCFYTMLEAAEHGDLASLERCLARGDSVSAASGPSGRTPLHRAAERGHMSCVAALLQAAAQQGGANAEAALANSRNARGLTPSFLAAECGHGQVVRLLEKHGAKVLAASPMGWGPMEVAQHKVAVDSVAGNTGNELRYTSRASRAHHELGRYFSHHAHHSGDKSGDKSGNGVGAAPTGSKRKSYIANRQQHHLLHTQ